MVDVPHHLGQLLFASSEWGASEQKRHAFSVAPSGSARGSCFIFCFTPMNSAWLACCCVSGRKYRSTGSALAWRSRLWTSWSLDSSAWPQWRALWAACCASTLTGGRTSMTSGWTASRQTSTRWAGARSWTTLWRDRVSKVRWGGGFLCWFLTAGDPQHLTRYKQRTEQSVCVDKHLPEQAAVRKKSSSCLQSWFYQQLLALVFQRTQPPYPWCTRRRRPRTRSTKGPERVSLAALTRGLGGGGWMLATSSLQT